MSSTDGNNIKIHNKLFRIDIFNSEGRPVAKLSPDQKRRVKDFNERILKGAIQFKYNKCLCGYNEFDLLAGKDSYSFLQSTVICRRCGLIMSNPSMTDDSYAEFYKDDTYRMCYEGDDFLKASLFRYDEGYGSQIFSEVNKLKVIDATTSCLEIGAGGGWNLVPFMKAGAHVLGLDYSRGLVQLGCEKGINMKQGSIEDINESFDVIVLNHALEHFSDPFGALTKISAHLKKDGFIYAAVPNINNYSLGQLQNAHVFYFNPDTFKYFCLQNSFKILAFGSVHDIHMFGILRLSENVENTVSLKDNYKSTMKIVHRMTLRHYMAYLMTPVLKRLHIYNAARLIYKFVKGRVLK